MATYYSLKTGVKQLTPYQSLQVWRAKQWAYNKSRIDQLNTATSGIFTANVKSAQNVANLAVQAAVTRMKSSVNTLV